MNRVSRRSRGKDGGEVGEVQIGRLDNEKGGSRRVPLMGPSLPANLADIGGAEYGAAAEVRKAVVLEEGEETEETRWSEKE